MILEVMSSTNYSLKRVCYTAAGFLWGLNSEVILMATNRIHKDLTTVQPLLTSAVLGGISQWLTAPLAQHIASDLISLISSARPDVRQKAICVFYQISLRYPDALKAGFHALKLRLDDADTSVLFATLNVMKILYQNSKSPMNSTHQMTSSKTKRTSSKIHQDLSIASLCRLQPSTPEGRNQPKIRLSPQAANNKMSTAIQ